MPMEKLFTLIYRDDRAPGALWACGEGTPIMYDLEEEAANQKALPGRSACKRSNDHQSWPELGNQHELRIYDPWYPFFHASLD
ncbi:hypothetical protein N7468_009389 [Penicillium chermesinum]|uniref:Uncharacterized protein n=1 Tax=Penicillium chermesinum TaxID=63820 RepID=A0A9W9NHR5_9EURO|nr:uncharacterized protein N7468_009389 [Penicillium chermesinum]KAJ5220185.1 hypothetical protein N7468_009389 [Penicillium chermesinum]